MAGKDILTDDDDGSGVQASSPAQPHPRPSSPSTSPAFDTAPFPQPHNATTATATEQGRLRRGLGQRHLSMMGVAGAIGTGLFLGLGSAVRAGGPLGALLGYLTVGLVVCAVQIALGETTALFPATGAFVRHAELLVDPAWGFAVGWNLVYGNLLSIPSETAAVCVLVEFWMPRGGNDNNSSGNQNIPVSVAVILLFICLTLLVGLSLVRVVGEVEYVSAVLKILLVVFLILLGLVIDLGGVPGTPPLYFRYWRPPFGPFAAADAADSSLPPGAWGRFLGYWSVMTSAVFAFAGVESIAMAAAETRDPRRAIPAACRTVFLRVLLFYTLAIVVVGMLVASNDERLAADADDNAAAVTQSPFVIAAQAAHLPSAVPSIVNAVLVLSAWSSANQALLAGSRVLYGLALDRQAPAVFLRTTRWGAPWACVAFFAAFMLLAFMSLSHGALAAFEWLVSLTAAGVLVSWIAILLNHIRLRLALRAQHIPPSRLPWYSGRCTLYTSCCALFMCCLLLLTGGFTVFIRGNWSPQVFVSAYLDIPLVLAAFLICKLANKTKIVKLSDIPLTSALQEASHKHPHQADQA